MRITHAYHCVHGFGYCDLYGIDLENDDGGNMGDSDFTKGFDAFINGDPVNPRRVPPAGLEGYGLYFWFAGWTRAQGLWKTLMQNRSRR